MTTKQTPLDIEKMDDITLLAYLRVFETFRDDYLARITKAKNDLAENEKHLAPLSIEARRRGILGG